MGAQKHGQVEASSQPSSGSASGSTCGALPGLSGKLRLSYGACSGQALCPRASGSSTSAGEGRQLPCVELSDVPGTSLDTFSNLSDLLPAALQHWDCWLSPVPRQGSCPTCRAVECSPAVLCGFSGLGPCCVALSSCPLADRCLCSLGALHGASSGSH